MGFALIALVVVLVVASVIASAIKVVKEYERGVMSRADPRVLVFSCCCRWWTGWSR